MKTMYNLKNMKTQTFSGNIVDVLGQEIYPGTIRVSGGKITEIIRENKKYKTFLIPGFVDSHIHVESSMLPPSEFARVATTHGTVAAVADPHEIANVLGMKGMKYVMDNAKGVPFKFYFSAPSCVPATTFETSGATLGVAEIEELCKKPEIKYLGEMMNFPGVICGDPIVMEKIAIAKKYGKLTDGHAPGLRGENLKKYVGAGISTDHEAFQKDEALEKLSLGMKILIREGSAVKNFEELIPIADEHFENCMLCSDDKHPDDLARSHINELVRRAVKKGIAVMKVLRMASVNPVLHYGLSVGLLRKNDSADFIEVGDLKKFDVLRTVIGGETVAKGGKSLLKMKRAKLANNFRATAKKVSDFSVPSENGNIKIIEALDGSLITKKVLTAPKIENGNIISDVKNDILKIVVVNRYANAKPAVAFIKNFGLKRGAIASSVAHDSHNIVAVGVSDEEICKAVNLIIKNKGGVCAVSQKGKTSEILPLPIAGLMSDGRYDIVAKKYIKIDTLAKSFGSRLRAPFMTLSFMALLVIPEIKLSDLGLFDGTKFQFTELSE
jgi:adenine deaminase